MKKHSALFGIAALLSAAMFIFAGCDNGSGGGSLAEVSGLNATPGNGQVTLTWTDPAGFYFEKVRITFTPAVDDVTQPVEVPKGDKTATIDGLANGTAYTFTVKAVYTYGSTSAGITVREKPVSEGVTGAAKAADVDVAMSSGTAVDSGNDTVTVTVNNGTVKATLAADDITIEGLPAGLTATPAKGTTNDIVITIGGTASPEVTANTAFTVIVKASAVSEDAITRDSAAISGFSVKAYAPDITYTVTFESNGGSAVSPINNIASGATITAPTPPTKAGNTFAAWYKEAGLTNLWNFGSDTVTGNITLYAKWTPDITYTVTFDSNGGSTVSPISNVVSGTTITAPANPTKDGNTFAGWYKEAGLTNLWTFGSDTVTGNITLYAKWTPDTYTVTFNSNGGSAVSPINNVVSGATITAPAAPTKMGYTFDAWYKEAGLTNLWTFGSDTVTGNITLYAKWTPVYTSDVYVAGYETIGGKTVATVWKNGTANDLTDGTQNAQAYAVYVSGGDVYVAGYEYNGSKYVAKVWKNGVETSLTTGTYSAYARAIYVSGSDVYVAGYEGNSSGKEVAKVWKNGVEEASLTDGSNIARAYAVYVSGSDVYAAGYERISDKEVAKVWKNGTLLTTLGGGTYSANAQAMYVSGSDVYAAGYENSSSNYIAKVWKNSAETSLTDGTNSAFASAVYVSGSDVYVAGYESNGSKNVAKVWKNGTALTALTDGTNHAYARAIYVSGSDVYVAGYENNGVAKVWKNGVATNLTDGTTAAEARSVFVVE